MMPHFPFKPDKTVRRQAKYHKLFWFRFPYRRCCYMENHIVLKSAKNFFRVFVHLGDFRAELALSKP